MARRLTLRARVVGMVGVFALGVVSATPALGQTSDASALLVEANVVQKAAPRRAYRFELHARNGTPPFKWKLFEGDLPAGIKLGEDGVLSGTPASAGVFHFTVKVTDSSNPPQTAKCKVELQVVPPLLLEWKKYATVTANRIDGSVLASNGTDDDFDLTFVVLAVAENGRATAIGYQRFALNRGVVSFEIPFGDALPSGTYALHVDAIAEVAPKDLIYRARLQSKEKLRVIVGP